MRLSKRILSTILSIALLATCLFVMPVSADFSDVESGTKVYNAVSVLSKLGVINGYEDGTFQPNNNVTRAEFTAMLLRTRGLGSIGSTSLENPPFPDVTTSDVSWAIGNIRTAYEMGIINGYEDGTFKPNNNVLYEEAIKMVVCALGYANYSAEGSEWYSKYVITANSLKILNDVGGAIGVPASRAMIASMLYNCLDVKIATDNAIGGDASSILGGDLKLVKKTGVVESDGVTSLSEADVNLRNDEIRIKAPNDANTGYEVKTYKVSNASQYREKLGTQIDFYYNGDDSAEIKTVTLANERNTVTKELKAKDIEPAECSSSAIAYYENDKASSTRSYSVASNSTVIYNGKLYGANATASTFAQYMTDNGKAGIPSIGSIKLIDTEGDGTYDVLYINKYDAYVVSSTTSSTYTIVDDVLRKDLPNKGNQVVLNPNDGSRDVSIYDLNGNTKNFSSIKKGDVVCVKTSSTANGGKVVVEAVVSDKFVSGTVSGISSGKSVKIGSTTYKYSEQAPWVSQIVGSTKVLDEPKMSDSGKFYLDMDGNVIAYDKNVATSNQKYGYIMSAIYNAGTIDDSTLYLHILDASGTKTKYTVSKKTKVNGTSYDTIEEIRDALALTSESALLAGKLYDEANVSNNDRCQQVVKFSTTTLNGSIVLENIITVTSSTILTSGQDVENDKLTFYDSVSASDNMKYSSSNKQLKKSGVTLNIKNSVLFSVPADRSKTNNYIKVDSLNNNTDYKVVAYDVTAAGSAGVVVVYHGIGDTTAVTGSSPVVVVTDCGGEYDPTDGSTWYQIEGYNGSSKSTYRFASTPSVTVNVGDVVRLGKDTDGYYTLKPEHIVFSTTAGFRDGVKVYDKNHNSSGNTVANNNGIYVDSDDNQTYKETIDEADQPAYRAVWGSAMNKDEDYLNVSLTLLTGGASDSPEQYTIERSKFNGAKIYVYDLKNGLDMDAESVYVPSSDNQGTIDSLDMYTANSGNAPSELFIVMSGGNVKTMIIVKR